MTGEYDRLEPDEDRVSERGDSIKRDIVQIAIANELAEMNYLKRLDMICATDSNGKRIHDMDEVMRGKKIE